MATHDAYIRIVVASVRHHDSWDAGPEDCFAQSVRLDTIFMSAKAGCACYLLYAEHYFATLFQTFVAIPLAYTVADDDISDFLDKCLKLKRQDTALDRLRDQ